MTTTPVAVDEASWHRLSPRMLLIHPINELVRALPLLLGAVLAGVSNGRSGWYGLVVAGAVTLLSISRWFTTTLRITAENVQLREGLLRRHTLSTARDRVRTVDVTSHVMHRLLGLARVVVGTGGNDSKGEGRLVLDGLTAERAASLRDELLHRAPQPDAEMTTGEPENPRTLARLDPRWIWLAPCTLSGIATGLVLWGLFWRVRGESGVDLARWGPVRDVTDWLHGLPVAAEVIVVVAAVVAFVAITSTAGYVLAYWNFRLVRHEAGTLEVTRGLITTRATSIERRRLVGAETVEPLLLRWAGGARTLAVATGLRTGRGAERGGEVLLPPAPRAVSLAVTRHVLDESPAVTADLIPHGLRARRRRLLRATIFPALVVLITVLIVIAGGALWPLPVALGLLAPFVPLGADRYRNLGHRRAAGYLVTSAGSLVRARTMLAEPAIIGVTLRATFFQRRAGLATLTATTAAGRQGYPVLDVDEHEAVALADGALPGLLTQFAAAPQIPASDSDDGAQPPRWSGLTLRVTDFVS